MSSGQGTDSDNLVVEAARAVAQTAADRRANNAGWYWPLIIVGLLAIPVVFGGWLAWEATHDPTELIEKDYYKKAVAWDQQLAARQASLKLGWKAEILTLRQQAPGSAVPVTVRLRGADGQPLKGATASVQLLHNRDPKNPLKLNLSESDAGTYQAQVVLTHPGMYQLDGTAARGSDAFQWTQRVELQP